MTAVPAPLNVTMNQVERVSGGGNVTITASWMQPSNFDIDRYDISVSSTSGIQQMATACGECTNTTITITENPGNVSLNTTFNTTIAVRSSCGETSPAAFAVYILSKFSCTICCLSMSEFQRVS